jgi:hypothetical protein
MYDPTSSINQMEDQMTTALKSLTFTTVPKPGANPTLDRRAKVIERLEEQKLLLTDPTYKRIVRTSVKKDGERTVVEKHHRVLPWWRSVPNGTFASFIRAGFKPIEFDKGKTAIAVASLDKLPYVIDTLITAVRNGEPDEHLAQAAKQATPKKPKKAA